jgi:hypothetical protein
MMFCNHNWSFPRRYAVFGEHRNVDVQTCLACGSRRLSSIQFNNSSLNRDTATPPSRALEPADA